MQVLARVDKIKASHFDHRKFDFEWISKKKKEFENVFDTNKSATPTVMEQDPPTFDADMVFLMS